MSLPQLSSDAPPPAPRPAAPRRRPLAQRIGTPLVVALSALPILWIAWSAYADHLGANPIREIVIRTGLWTLRFLALSLAVTPLRRLSGWSEIARQRRTLGLVTFFYATVHLSSYIGLDQAFDWGDITHDVLKHRYTFVGMATYLTLLPLALTSTKKSIRRLGGRRWNALHRLVYLAAITGTIHYLWAVKKDTSRPLLYLLIFVALLGIRLAWWWDRRRARAAIAT
ncbi:MAG: sulfoxide reductase heme-binding subunit YedZ [Gemmatimonadaceae bacterium]|nr:sulfoxide reductase heme-binding subunit YedZ [Gemmatimonadaceae bacterium]